MKNVYMILLTLFISNGIIKAQIRWDSASLHVNKLFPYGISAVNSNVAWTMTWGGNFTVSPWRFVDTAHHFSRTIDGGRTWSSGVYPFVDYGYTPKIFGVSADIAWVAHSLNSGDGLLFQTKDGGNTWTMPYSRKVPIAWVHFWDSENGIILYNPDFAGFGIYKTNDGGVTWKRRTTLPAHLPGEGSYGGVYSAKGNVILFATSRGRIFRSTDNGESWAVSATLLPTSQEYNDISCDGKGNCIVSGGIYRDSLAFTGRFYTSSDNGTTWTAQPLHNFVCASAQYIPGTSTIIAAGRNNNNPLKSKFRVILSHDNGASWQVIDTTVRIFSLSFIDKNTGFATRYPNDNNETMAYRYLGSPLTGLWQGEILRGHLKLFPNPILSGELQISLNDFETGEYRLLVNSMNGELIESRNIEYQTPQNIVIPTSHWLSGMYFVTLTSAKGKITQKVIKTN